MSRWVVVRAEVVAGAVDIDADLLVAMRATAGVFAGPPAAGDYQRHCPQANHGEPDRATGPT